MVVATAAEQSDLGAATITWAVAIRTGIAVNESRLAATGAAPIARAIYIFAAVAVSDARVSAMAVTGRI